MCISCRRQVIGQIVMLLVVLLSCGSCSDRIPTIPPPLTPAPSTVSLAVNVAPTTSFAVSPRWPAPGDTVTVDGAFSHDSDGQVLAYRWDFGTGSAQNTSAQARTVYRTAGTYTLELTTYDDSGASNTVSLALVVSSAGAPSNAISGSTSTLTLSAATTAAGTGVTATVTARNGGGTVQGGVPVAISARGRNVVVLPPSSTTNGVSGIATGTLTSTVAQTLSVRAVADFTALTAAPSLTVTPSVVGSTRSAIRLTQSTLATVFDTAIVEVTVRDTAGNAVSGTLVSLASSVANVTLPASGFTDANGRWTGTVRSGALCSGTSATLTATAGGTVITPTVSIVGSGVAAYGACGVSFWVDGSDTSTLTLDGSNRVSEWRDKSGRATHAVQATVGLRPVSTANSIRGRRSVRIGAGSRIDSPDALAGLTNKVEVFMVAASDIAQMSNPFSAEEAPQRFSVHLPWTDGAVYWDYGDINATGGRLSVSIGTTSTDLRPSVFSFATLSGASPERHIRRDGSVLTTGSGTVSLGLVSRALRLGRAWDGYFGEMLIFARELTALERTSVEQSLMVKWGLGTIAITAGDAQSVNAGTSPSTAPRVRVTDLSGSGLPGASVTFQVTGGGGRVNGGTTLTVTTDASGYASVPANQWVLDVGSNTLTAWYNTMAGSGSSVVFTGTGTLPSGLALRLDASDTTTLLQGSACTGAIAVTTQAVRCWLDKSGNAYNAVQTISGAEPTAIAPGINGRRALAFVLTRENWLGVTNATIRNLRGAASTLFVAAQAGATENNSDNGSSALAVWQGYHNGLLVYGHPTVSALSHERWPRADGGSSLFVSAGGVVSGTPFVATALTTFTSASDYSGSVYLNGTLGQTAFRSDNAAGGASDFRIGQGNVAPTTAYRYRLDGRIGEVVLFNRSLTTTERQIVERYMGWKWGVTVQ